MSKYAKESPEVVKGGFNLRKWQSNDKSTLGEISRLEQQQVNLKPCDNDKSAVNEDNQAYSDFVIGSPSASG